MPVYDALLNANAPPAGTPTTGHPGLDALLGLTPPVLDTATEAPYHPSGLQSFLTGFSGLEANPAFGNPHNFGQGLLGGLAMGLGRAGTRQAQQQAQFELAARERQAKRDAANVKATEAYQLAHDTGARDLAVQAAKTANDLVTITPENVKANPGLAPYLGTKQPKEWTKPLPPEKPTKPEYVEVTNPDGSKTLAVKRAGMQTAPPGAGAGGVDLTDYTQRSTNGFTYVELPEDKKLAKAVEDAARKARLPVADKTYQEALAKVDAARANLDSFEAAARPILAKGPLSQPFVGTGNKLAELFHTKPELKDLEGYATSAIGAIQAVGSLGKNLRITQPEINSIISRNTPDFHHDTLPEALNKVHALRVLLFHVEQAATGQKASRQADERYVPAPGSVNSFFSPAGP